jgi:HSP20 family protein
MARSSFLDDIVDLRTSINQLLGENPFGESFNHLRGRADASGGTIGRPMPLDIYASADQVVIVAAVPGMNPDDVELTVQQNTVTLSGAVQADTGVQGATWYLHELPSGTYWRSVTLPFPVDVDRAEATFEHGMLRIVLPKTEASKPTRIAITTSPERTIGVGADH